MPDQRDEGAESADEMQMHGNEMRGAGTNALFAPGPRPVTILQEQAEQIADNVALVRHELSSGQAATRAKRAGDRLSVIEEIVRQHAALAERMDRRTGHYDPSREARKRRSSKSAKKVSAKKSATSAKRAR